MEINIKETGDITYVSELTLDTNTMISKIESYVSRVKFADACEHIKTGGYNLCRHLDYISCLLI